MALIVAIVCFIENSRLGMENGNLVAASTTRTECKSNVDKKEEEENFFFLDRRDFHGSRWMASINIPNSHLATSKCTIFPSLESQ